MNKWLAKSYNMTYIAYETDNLRNTREQFFTYGKARQFARLCNQLGCPSKAKIEMRRLETRRWWFARLKQRLSDWYWCYNQKREDDMQ